MATDNDAPVMNKVAVGDNAPTIDKTVPVE